VSKTYPQLAEEGAYLYPEAAYSVADMKKVVAYGRARGVRVMPEWDVPGHGSWGFGVPEVMITDGPCTDTMDPTKQETYDFLSTFLQEMVTIFPDAYLFLGGDEVQTSCFTESPSVSAWMAANDIADGVALQSYFWQQVTAQVMPALNRTLGVWMADDGIPYPEDLPAGSFGNVWQSQSMTAPVIDRGAKVVLSGPWYLDQQRPGGYEVYALQQMWQGMYAVEPYFNLTEVQQQQLLGGQACMWGEGINGGDFDAYAVTKAAAVAERLWSPQNVTDTTAAQPRLIEHVCRLNMRGINAEPIYPSFCLTDVQ
jgi:hexosaminidase